MPIIFLWFERKIWECDKMFLIKLFFTILEYKKTSMVYPHAERTWPKILQLINQKYKE